MPWMKQQRGKNYVVVNSETGRVVAGNVTPLTSEKADKVLAALYAKVDEGKIKK